MGGFNRAGSRIPAPLGESLEIFNSDLETVHEAFYDLVRLVPAQQ
jgi:hypothetical protein